MINSSDFVSALEDMGIDFFAGVPDSLLKDFCAFLQDNRPRDKNIIAANEGGAIALGAGHYLGTGRPALIYMQNSGQGNAVNPLLSLNDPLVYGIPALLMIGWRGEPDTKDEPQHKKQGLVTRELLDTMDIPYGILTSDMSDDEWKKCLNEALDHTKKNKVYALIIKKGTFSPYKLKNVESDISSFPREKAISLCSELAGENSFIVSTTGKISRELYESRDRNGKSHSRDFLTVGSMGHASQIACGIAQSRSEKRIFCFDGDGAVLMQMGGLPIAASLKQDNYYHIVFNNGAHDSVGGQPTIASGLSLTAIAKDSGYGWTGTASNENEIREKCREMLASKGPCFLEVLVAKGSRDDLGRPKMTPKDQMNDFMEELKK